MGFVPDIQILCRGSLSLLLYVEEVVVYQRLLVFLTNQRTRLLGTVLRTANAYLYPFRVKDAHDVIFLEVSANLGDAYE